MALTTFELAVLWTFVAGFALLAFYSIYWEVYHHNRENPNQ